MGAANFVEDSKRLLDKTDADMSAGKSQPKCGVGIVRSNYAA